MRSVTSYIFRQLLWCTLVTVLGLTAILWLSQALHYMDYIVNQGISIDLFLFLTLLIIPSLLLIVMPIGLFCAVLFIYHRLRQDSELTVMEAAGLSRWQRMRPALYAACVVAVLGYGVSFFLMPYSYGKFKEWQAIIRTNYASVLLQDGVFNSPTDSLTVFVREKMDNGVLKGILVHDNRRPDAPVTMMAESGRLEKGPQGQRILLENGTRQEIRNHRISFLDYETYTLDLAFAQAEASSRQSDLQEMYVTQLFDSSGVDDKEAKRRRGEAHQRLLWPSYAFSLTFIALATLLTGEFNRRGQLRRMALAVALGVGLMAGAITLRSLTGQNMGYLFAAYASVVLPVLIGSAAVTDSPVRLRPLAPA